MASKDMVALGAQSSVIRDLFAYGQAQAAIVGKENVFDFSIGNPAVPPPDSVAEAICHIVQSEPAVGVHGYTMAAGDRTVREGLAAYMNKTYQAQVTADNFYMTCGAAASLTISLKALVENATDEIILVAPFFPEYTVFIKNAGACPVILPPDTEHFQISPAALEAAITPQTVAIILNSPNNPSGVVYAPETYAAVAEILKRKSEEIGHPIYIISDEPYREIIYDGKPIVYVPKYYANTIICYSYSKSLSLPGERIGYILVPPQVTDVELYDRNRKLLYGSLTEMGYECVYPDGAFYLFVKSPEADATAFSEKAKKLCLLIVPADSFGCPGYVRISYCVEEAMIRRSLPVFKKLIDGYTE